jgi:hypothetical protein
MPANLNALIRYKTINSALYGGNRRWSILELIERCSDALAEYRGRYEPVSERTIRDDIRVMRGDILGYNAPIAQQKGLYYYSDKDYSIMTISFTDSGLVDRIIRFLGEIKPEVAHPELEIILEKLNNLKISYYANAERKKEIQLDAGSPVKHSELEEFISQIRQPINTKASRRKIIRAEEEFSDMVAEPGMPWYHDLITWGDLFLIIKQ